MNKTILLVEDDQDLIQLYEISLKKAGFAVITAENGLEGITSSLDVQPDLILLDMMMPMADGRDVLSMTRLNPQLKEIPIIIISNLNPGTVDLSGFDDQIIDYWVKSNITPTSLTDKLTSYFS